MFSSMSPSFSVSSRGEVGGYKSERGRLGASGREKVGRKRKMAVIGAK